jgi:TPR repeat protein
VFKKYAFAAAIVSFGLVILSGCGKSQNSGGEVRARSLEQLWSFAESGNADAQYKLGFVYDDCTIYPARNCKEAVRWYRLAANQGHAAAAFRLGVLLSEGLGIHEDVNEGFRLELLAAKQGIPMAQIRIASAYHTGKAVAQNDAEALRWYRRAAEQGNAMAQVALGLMYEMAQGTSLDYVRAHMWFNLAAGRGYKGTRFLKDNPIPLRDAVAAKMSPEQIRQSQEMATRCEASHYQNC